MSHEILLGEAEPANLDYQFLSDLIAGSKYELSFVMTPSVDALIDTLLGVAGQSADYMPAGIILDAEIGLSHDIPTFSDLIRQIGNLYSGEIIVVSDKKGKFRHLRHILPERVHICALKSLGSMIRIFFDSH